VTSKSRVDRVRDNVNIKNQSKPHSENSTLQKTKSWSNEEFEEVYEPVTKQEFSDINQLRDRLKQTAPEFNRAIANSNTKKRDMVLDRINAAVSRKEVTEKYFDKHLNKILEEIFSGSLQERNIGQMYVPMEKNLSTTKLGSRENTDYDTFGSIDSLIFEPKIPTEEDIVEVQEEITLSFEYLEKENGSGNKYRN